MTRVERYLERLFYKANGFEGATVWAPVWENSGICRFCEGKGALTITGLNGVRACVTCPTCSGSGISLQKYVPKEYKLLRIAVGKSADGKNDFTLQAEGFLSEDSEKVYVTKTECQKRCEELNNENERTI